MEILTPLIKLFNFFMNIWRSLSEEQRESILETATDWFEEMFREYFRANNGATQ